MKNAITNQTDVQIGENTKGIRTAQGGEIKYTQVTPYIKLLHYKNKSKIDQCEEVEIKNIDHYKFAVNLATEITFYLNGDSISIQKNEGFIYKGNSLRRKIYLEKEKNYEFIFLHIDHNALRSTIENCQLKDYSPFLEKEKLAYKMNSNLKVLDHINRIKNDGSNSPLRIGLIAEIYSIIDLMIAQYINETDDRKENTSALKNWEIEEIHKISFEIEQNPERGYTVPNLAGRTGVSIPRLQTGFKEMHDMTIAIYIREMRLQKAEYLIRKAEYNISEVVYSIGLTSRSYFSRIFKNRYGSTPTDYRKKFAS